MTESSETNTGSRPAGLLARDYLLLYVALALWITFFLAGTMINSAPYREQLANLSELSAVESLKNALVVVCTYTLTNVAFLCLLAGLLGTIGRRSQLGSDLSGVVDKDTINPRSSALLRAFLVYLALISGVLILGDDPAQPTQRQYVRLAGFISLVSFVVNARPSLFGNFLVKLGGLFESAAGRKGGTE